jgi:hypothetical protein
MVVKGTNSCSTASISPDWYPATSSIYFTLIDNALTLKGVAEGSFPDYSASSMLKLNILPSGRERFGFMDLQMNLDNALGSSTSQVGGTTLNCVWPGYGCNGEANRRHGLILGRPLAVRVSVGAQPFGGAVAFVSAKFYEADGVTPVTIAETELAPVPEPAYFVGLAVLLPLMALRGVASRKGTQPKRKRA